MNTSENEYATVASLAASIDAACANRDKTIADLRAEIECLIWNLAGCDTYAMGYGLDSDHDKSMARPALESVRRMALKKQELEKALADIVASHGSRAPISLEAGRDNNRWHAWLIKRVEAAMNPAPLSPNCSVT